MCKIRVILTSKSNLSYAQYAIAQRLRNTLMCLVFSVELHLARYEAFLWTPSSWESLGKRNGQSESANPRFRYHKMYSILLKNGIVAAPKLSLFLDVARPLLFHTTSLCL